jgi:divalent metal cation (Fe/Co/Zn/Cd) transporter
MSTNAVRKTATKTKVNNFNLRAFASFALGKMSDSLFDMVVTVMVTAITILYIGIELPMYAATNIPGLLILASVVQLFIRIVHRFDDHYTTDELAERMIEFQADVKEQLDRIERNS